MDTSLVDFGNRIGSGGTAEIYGVISDPGLVAKIYNQPRKANFNKIREISSRLLTADFAASLAIPKELIVGPGGFVGFTQQYFNKAQYLELDYWIEGALKKRLSQTQQGLSFRIQILHSLANVISRLHENHIAIVDLKPSNVLVDRNTGEVALVDCDAFCVLDEDGKIEYPAYEVTVGYCNGDALRNGTPPTQLGYEQDSFAFAVIAFQILNNGIHPFQGVVQSNVTDHNLESLTRKGVYPYGGAQSTEVLPLPISVHGTFPVVLGEAFERSFASGRKKLEVKQWASLLNEIIDKNLVQVCKNLTPLGVHWKFAEHPCPDCRYSELIGRSSAPGPSKPIIQNGNAAQRKAGPLGAPAPPRPTPAKKSSRFSTGMIIATALAIVISVFLVRVAYRPKETITSELNPRIETTKPAVTKQQDPIVVPEAPPVKPAPTTPPVPQPATDSLSKLTPVAVCRTALNVTRTGWDSSRYYQKYVDEAQRRSFTVSQCQSLLGPEAAPASTPTVSSTAPVEFKVVGACDIVGFDLSLFKNSSVDECKQHCNDSSACNAFVFNNWNALCITKSSVSPRVIDVSADCYVNRPETSYDAGYNWDFKQLKNKRFSFGKAIQTTKVDSLSDCEAECRKNDSCFGANFDRTSMQCQLLNSLDSPAQPDFDSDAVYIFTAR